VKLWHQLIQDIPHLTHILDFTPGSAALAIASAQADIKYEGICTNKLHKDWLDNFLDKSMFAVVAKGVAGKNEATNKDAITKLQHFFSFQVANGMRYLDAAKAKAAKAEEAAQQTGPAEADQGVLDDDDY